MPVQNSTRKTISILAIICAIAVFVFLGIDVQHPGPVDSTFSRQVSTMGQICKKFRDYNYEHPNIKPEDVAGRSISEDVRMGILTSEDSAYIEDNEITFEGFDPNKIGGDIPVLEAIYTNTGHPKRIVGYSDASVRCFPLDYKN